MGQYRRPSDGHLFIFTKRKQFENKIIPNLESSEKFSEIVK